MEHGADDPAADSDSHARLWRDGRRLDLSLELTPDEQPGEEDTGEADSLSQPVVGRCTSA